MLAVGSVQDESAVDNCCYLPVLRDVHVCSSHASLHFSNKVHFGSHGSC